MIPKQFAPFLLWLIGFYSVWLAIVLLGHHGATLVSHWHIALAMLLGSYVAGSTPMGGGTIGFPVLVLLFELPGSLGRNFGLAIQSIGMVSASIFLLCGRQLVAWPMLWPALLGSLVGTPFGVACVAPFVSDMAVKLTFAVVWASFGVMLLVKRRELSGNTNPVQDAADAHGLLGLTVGLTGGIVSSITGVGIDMMIYAALVLRDRADLKVAIPTSVILMAFTSVIGITSNLTLANFSSRYAVDPEVFHCWLAAAPVVALGAPIGSYMVQLIPRGPTLIFVSLLCVGQFFWTVYQERVSWTALTFCLIAIAVMNGIFMWLHRLGHRPDMSVESEKLAMRPE